MVSNEEIKKNLDLKRKGIDPYDPNLKDKFCPKCGTKNSFTSDFCLECGQSNYYNLVSIRNLTLSLEASEI